MKGCLLLFAVYLLSLMTIPCADGKGISHNDAETFATATHQHNPDHNNLEKCTPFCICNCCSVVTAALPVISYSPVKPFSPGAVRLSFYADTYLDGVPSNIWQPPKMQG